MITSNSPLRDWATFLIERHGLPGNQTIEVSRDGEPVFCTRLGAAASEGE